MYECKFVSSIASSHRHSIALIDVTRPGIEFVSAPLGDDRQQKAVIEGCHGSVFLYMPSPSVLLCVIVHLSLLVTIQ